MAQFSNGKTYNTMGLPMNITRGNPIPVDATEIWYSLEDAQTYAQEDPTAYVGQTIKVIDEDNETVVLYLIGTDGSLVSIEAETPEIEIEAIPDADIIALFNE